MHLKRLDLVGFKSFATRTTLTFEPGITVLCGPNGSGKSNVSDAVRWALGETSARAIRGRKGEDVIFVGSQGRQPLGLAEVSLTLDNSDGRIPLEYDEVKITRRYYRSGDAEYLVNGARVRLKDIHEWLLHAALDPHAYVVVGQGSVDELILQRAEERRAVLENAADIRRHHTRLAETRSKLASADENLLRCRAVIAELEPHVNRLRTQADRAGRYRACQDELSGLASRWFRLTQQAATRELDTARTAAASSRAKVERLEEGLAELEEHARGAAASALEAEDLLASEETALAALQAEQSRVVRELAVAAERDRGGRDALVLMQRDLDGAHERAVALEAETASLEERLASATRDLDVAVQALAEAPTVAEGERAARETEERLATQRRRVAALEVDHQVSDRGVRDGRASVERLASRIAESVEELARAEAALAEGRGAAERFVAEAAERRGESERLRAQREQLATEREATRRRLAALRGEQHREQGERQRLHIAIGALEDVGGDSRGASMLLEAKLGGVGGLLGGELRVPRRFQAAISAALGESARSVLIESADGACAGIRLVDDRGVDRVGMLVTNGAAEVPPADIAADFQRVARPLLADLEWQGFADELVTCDPKLEAVRSRCLAFAVVAPSLDVAREAARRLSSNGTAAVPWQVVTLAGHAIRWNGEWRAGRDRGAERLVARRDELFELQQQLGEMEERLARVAEGLAEVEDRSKAIVAEETELRSRVAAAEAADRRATLAVQSATATVGRAERDLQRARAADPNARDELSRAERDIQELLARLEAIDREREQARRDVEQAESAVSQAQARLDELRAARAERRADASVRRSALEGQQQLLKRLRSERADVGRLADELEQQLQSEREQLRANAERSRELTATRAEVVAQLGPREEAVAQLRAARRRGSEERAELDRRAAGMRASTREYHTALEAASIAETRAADRLERIQREAQEWLEELGLESWVPEPTDAASDDPTDDLSRDTDVDLDAMRRRMTSLRRELRAIGPVNEGTLAEFDELRERHAFLSTQTIDLETAVAELRGAMDELQTMMRGAFDEAFAKVNGFFGEYFARLFGGGHAELVLTQADDVLESGVDIVARPPGKRLQPLVSLSGGERALTMVALIFALLKTNPSPFCVLDEVDAALDESNVVRFTQMLRELSDRTQFLVVTHNRGTMEVARALYGVTMDAQGVSSIVSLRLDSVPA